MSRTNIIHNTINMLDNELLNLVHTLNNNKNNENLCQEIIEHKKNRFITLINDNLYIKNYVVEFNNSNEHVNLYNNYGFVTKYIICRSKYLCQQNNINFNNLFQLYSN